METTLTMESPSYEKSLGALKDYKGQNWKQIGAQDGLRQHSAEAFEEAAGSIIQDFNQLCMNLTDALLLKLFETDVDLLQVSAMSAEATSKGNLSRQYWEQQLAHYRLQITLKHREDPNSECKAIFVNYRSGYKWGVDKYMEVRGVKI